MPNVIYMRNSRDFTRTQARPVLFSSPDSSIDSDISFSRLLLQEESVFVLPGQCFQYPNFFRVVITPPLEKLVEACGRIRAFCERHKKAGSSSEQRKPNSRGLVVY
jgi:aspartate/methionine/tyrosine aminotransferase